MKNCAFLVVLVLALAACDEQVEASPAAAATPAEVAPTLTPEAVSTIQEVQRKAAASRKAVRLTTSVTVMAQQDAPREVIESARETVVANYRSLIAEHAANPTIAAALKRELAGNVQFYGSVALRSGESSAAWDARIGDMITDLEEAEAATQTELALAGT